MEINVKICKDFKSRLLGLMFKKNFDYILCFPKCNSIHTFFMKQAIDVYMTDKNNKIIYIYKSLKPWQVILPKKNIYYTYETMPNLLNYSIGEYLNIEKENVNMS